MLPAIFATILFSVSVIFAAKSSKVLGGTWANLGRITVAMVLLAIWGHAVGRGLSGPALPWFLFSGVIGFGLGDIALFGSLTRIGPRLAILLTQCLGAPLATLAEWGWLGTTLRPAELLCGGVILAGVALALAPDHGWPTERRTFWAGVAWGVGSAMGQAFGAVISRKAYAVAAAGGFSLDGGTAAYQRIIGGVAITWIALLCTQAWRKAPVPSAGAPAEQAVSPGAGEPPLVGVAKWRKAAPLVLINALAGPVIGVGCFQWALYKYPSGIVLPIVATSPLVTIIISAVLDGHRPAKRATFGGLLAVAGAVCLKIAQTR